MRAAVIFGCALLCGCAAAPVAPVAPDAVENAPLPGWLQAIEVQTNPPGARCSLRQGPDEIAAIASTPAKIAVVRTHASLALECSLEDHFEAREVFAAFSGRESVAISPYGVAGATIALDSAIYAAPLTVYASAGAVATATVALPIALAASLALIVADQNEIPRLHYPPVLMAVLIPQTYTSEEERDAFLAPFVRREEEKARAEVEWPCHRLNSSHSECFRARNSNEPAVRAAAWRESIIARTRIVPP
jgi:hypothetical protein